MFGQGESHQGFSKLHALLIKLLIVVSELNNGNGTQRPLILTERADLRAKVSVAFRNSSRRVVGLRLEMPVLAILMGS